MTYNVFGGTLSLTLICLYTIEEKCSSAYFLLLCVEKYQDVRNLSRSYRDFWV